MACLSPSPSGRRLSELLEEKQEPFILDLHLLEKGCSTSRLLDGGYDTAALNCWPTNDGGAAAAVLQRLTSKKSKTATKPTTTTRKKQQQQHAGGILHLLLSKILRGSRAAAAQRKPAKLQFSDSFNKLAATTTATTNPAAVAPAPCSDDLDRHMEKLELDAVKTTATDAKTQHDRYYSDDDDDDEKQHLSPVSVLDHPFETSPVHGGKLLLSPSSKGAAAAMPMDVFRDLLDASYSPALLTELLAKSEDLLLLRDDATDEDDSYYGGGYRTSPKNRRDDDESAAGYWDVHREELARVSELVASELPTSKLDAADVQPERRDVGVAVEAAVFQTLLEELIVDLRSY